MARHAAQRQTEDQGRDDGDFVAFEDVGGHAGAVADVVAHQVGDDCSVARVVFGQILLDLAHQIGAHVSSLGVDAAPHSHEERQQRAAKAEAQQGVRRCHSKDDEDYGAAKKTQAVGQHSGDGAGAIGNTQRTVETATGCLCNTNIRLHCHAHADLTDDQAEERTHDECARPPEPNDDLQLLICQGWKALVSLKRWRYDVDTQEKSDCENSDKRQDRAQLPSKIRVRPCTDRIPNVHHGLGAGWLRQHLAAQEHGICQADQGNAQDHPYGNGLERG